MELGVDLCTTSQLKAWLVVLFVIARALGCAQRVPQLRKPSQSPTYSKILSFGHFCTGEHHTAYGALHFFIVQPPSST
jgi:hypothetical protein